ncbi:oocyte zinc finger protein XlCOF28-like [Anopheles albimanus]|uniref:C2H2-type domain-containing protein n=1 Tax=Anopheles albimanus TaxID=7167 RepID=A0A182F4W5_ANOAL|nr:oocyte zinc finger protein XlCOF28-like [Anopheles albimanus]
MSDSKGESKLPPPAYYYVQASSTGDGEDEDLFDSNGTLITSDYLNDSVAKSLSDKYTVLYDSNDSPIYKCNECNTFTHCTGHLVGHIAVHTGENPYSCRLCKRAFSNSTRLKLHLKIHCIIKANAGLTVTRIPKPSPTKITNAADQESPPSPGESDEDRTFSCIECSESLPKDKLYHHMKQHLLEKNIFDKKGHDCARCGMSFDKSTSLLRHAEECTGERAFDAGCDSIKVSSEVELVPIRRTEPGGDANPIDANPILSGLLMREQCPPGGTLSLTATDEGQEQLPEQPENQRTAGSQATTGVKSDAGLVISSVATVDEQFLENLAQMELQSRTPELEEMEEPALEPAQVHDDNLLICTICGRSFDEPFGLRQHLRIRHSDKKPFKCPECKKRFTEERIMLIHLRVHVSSQPFICIVCYKTFTRAAGLNGHLSCHSHESINCIECSAVTISVQKYARHIDARHPKFHERLQAIRVKRPEYERSLFLRRMLEQSIGVIVQSTDAHEVNATDGP